MGTNPLIESQIHERTGKNHLDNKENTHTYIHTQTHTHTHTHINTRKQMDPKNVCLTLKLIQDR